jgi:hypothetical protein
VIILRKFCIEKRFFGWNFEISSRSESVIRSSDLKYFFGIFFIVLIELRSELEPKGVPGGGFEDDSMMEEVVTMPEGEICLAARLLQKKFVYRN